MKHPKKKKKGRKRYKMEGPKSWQKEEITNWGRPQGEHEQIKRFFIYKIIPS
jgi:hypothetical protein